MSHEGGPNSIEISDSVIHSKSSSLLPSESRNRNKKSQFSLRRERGQTRETEIVFSTRNELDSCGEILPDSSHESLIILEEVFTPDYNVTEEEVAEYANRLGIDSKQDPDLFSLAKKALLAPLPRPWTPVKDKGNGVYYFNRETGESSWTHPVDASLKEYLKESKQKAKDVTDTDSCVDEIRTEEEFSFCFRKESDLSNRSNDPDSNQSVSILHISETKNNGLTQKGKEKEKDMFGDRNTLRPLDSLPPLGRGLPPVASLANDSKNQMRSGALKPLQQRSLSPNAQNSLASPLRTDSARNLSPSRLQPPQDKPSSRPNSASSQTSRNTRPVPKLSPLKSIIKQPTTEGNLRSLSPRIQDKNLRFEFNVDNISYSSSEGSDEYKVEHLSKLPAKNPPSSKLGNLSREGNSDGIRDMGDLDGMNTKQPSIDKINLTNETNTSNEQKSSNIMNDSTKIASSTLHKSDNIVINQMVPNKSTTSAKPNLAKEPLKSQESKEIPASDKPKLSKIQPSSTAKLSVNNNQASVTGSSAATSNKLSSTKNAPNITTAEVSKSVTVTSAVTNTVKNTTKPQIASSTTSTVISSISSNKETTTTTSTVPLHRAVTTAVNTTTASSIPKVSSATAKSTAIRTTAPKSNISKNNSEKSAVSSSVNSKTSVSKPKDVETITTNKSLASESPKIRISVSSKDPSLSQTSSLKTQKGATPEQKSEQTPSTITKPQPDKKQNVLQKETIEVRKPAATSNDKKTVMYVDTSSDSDKDFPLETEQIKSRQNYIREGKENETYLELEMGTKLRKTNNPMGRVVAKFTKNSEDVSQSRSSRDRNQAESGDVQKSEVSSLNPLLRRLEAEHDEDESKATQTSPIRYGGTRGFRIDHSTSTTTKLPVYGAEEDFLLVEGQEIIQDIDNLRASRRKRESALMEVSQSLERGMKDLLSERQNELKREHERAMYLLKRDLELSMDRLQREAANMEEKKNAEQLYRISNMQNMHKIEYEMMQKSHRDFMENLRQENEREMAEMKKELNRFVTSYSRERDGIQTGISNDTEHIRDATSGRSRQKEESFKREQSRDDQTMNLLLSELKSLRKEIETSKKAFPDTGAVKESLADEVQSPKKSSDCGNHKCLYGSKYSNIKKRYFNLIRKIQHKRETKRTNSLENPSTSSTSSDSSFSNLQEIRIPFSGSILTAEPSVPFELKGSSSDVTEAQIDLGERFVGVEHEDYLVESATGVSTFSPIKFSSTEWTNDPLIREGNRVLAQTLTFLKANRISDDEGDLALLDSLDFENQPNIQNSIASDSLSKELDVQNEWENSHFSADITVNDFPPFEYQSDFNEDGKTELDFILEKMGKKLKDEVSETPRRVAWDIPSDAARKHSFPPAGFEESFHQKVLKPSDDIRLLNEHFRQKWRTYFGDATVPLSGKSGWPTSCMSSTILPRAEQEPFLADKNSTTQPGFSSSADTIKKRIQDIRAWLNEANTTTTDILK